MNAYQDTANKFDRLRHKAEALIHTRDMDITHPDDILELIHELRIHQAELEIQNEELKRAQHEILDLQREYERLYEFAPCGYVTLNTKGIITHVNLTGVKMLGTPRMNLLHSGLSQFIADDWQSNYLAARKTAAETGENQTVELLLKKNNKPSRWVRADIQADRDANDAVFQWSAVLTDITCQREAQEENQRIEEQLRHAQKMETLGTLAGGIAHDFNNILTVIIGSYELIEKKFTENIQLKEYLEEIGLASQRAKDLVSQLLTFARRSDTQQTPTKLTPVVCETLKLVRSVIPANIHIDQHVPEDSGTILCNSTQIDQLILNLCTNAVDAMQPKGGYLTVALDKVTLNDAEARQTDALTSGPYVRIVVKDTGCGMDAHALEHIFEPYYTTKPLGKGTGIGLAVVHGIVNQHKGNIRVESTPGQGTTFSLLLPAYQGQVTMDSTHDTKLPKGNESILFVDDDAAVVKIINAALSYLGYRVTSTTDPRKALEMVKSNPEAFDLVITDMDMPNMTGDVLFLEIFRLRPGLPVIICTGYNENINAKKAYEMGISGFLNKPMAMAELSFTIRKLLDRISSG